MHTTVACGSWCESAHTLKRLMLLNYFYRIEIPERQAWKRNSGGMLLPRDFHRRHAVPYDLGQPGQFQYSTFYPAYLRGWVYLTAG